MLDTGPKPELLTLLGTYAALVSRGQPLQHEACSYVHIPPMPAAGTTKLSLSHSPQQGGRWPDAAAGAALKPTTSAVTLTPSHAGPASLVPSTIFLLGWALKLLKRKIPGQGPSLSCQGVGRL